MRRALLTAALAGGLLGAAPAAAQTPAASAAAARRPATATSAVTGARLFIGGIAGGGSVENVGGLLGGELGVRLSNLLDLVGEGLWMEDVVTRRRLGIANTVGAALQTSQGKTATATVTAPASYGGAGVRLMLTTSGDLRPYAVFGVGAAHVALKPVFTLNGSDITSTLPQYGVTLGSDLTGEVTKPAFTGGAGVQYAQPRWYAHGGVRVISIRTPDQATNVLTASVSVGVRF
jgi:opacity protein-like surface antigen